MYDLLELPSARLIEDQLITIARNTLLDQATPFLNLMRNGIPVEHRIFWMQLNAPMTCYVEATQKPTADKVVAVLQVPENLRQEEETCLHYLKEYIRQLDSDDLSRFIYFITGSTIMPDRIVVNFSILSGVERRPIAHTCGKVLELPTSYSCYMDLKREFKMFLGSEYSFDMTIV